MGLSGDQTVIVSDIGCSGLFDTFFQTHALHGLHGRALTYATGLKLARPGLNVVVTMGDGGLGIGGAHLLSACRRNLDLTLLIMNNFNFGMTGGQFSATTPPEAQVGSGFLNLLERPLDVCQVSSSAGAPYVTRCSCNKKDLSEEIERAIHFEGFSVIDIWGICTGRYTRQNTLTPQMIEEALGRLPSMDGHVAKNMRMEYGRHYRERAAKQRPFSLPAKIPTKFHAPEPGRQDVVILGSAGQRIITAGEILCLAGLTAGMKVTQKDEYDITVLRGPSICELILSPEDIAFTGIDRPTVILALGQEGVDRRRDLFDSLDQQTLIIQAHGVEVPSCNAGIHRVDFKGQGIKTHDWAIAVLWVLAKANKVIDQEMLRSALAVKFKGQALASALDLVDGVEMVPPLFPRTDERTR
jgi:pyruvate/2-oxoacid:ferredoxin oxidoreductase beta subunit